MSVYITNKTGDGNYINFNFYGLVIEDTSKNYIPHFKICVDVKETGNIQMVLPARNAIVHNQFYNNLILDIRRHIYSYIAKNASCGCGHSLSFSQWQEAHSLGVVLPPADRKLPQIGDRYDLVQLNPNRKCVIMDRSVRRGKFESVAAAMEISDEYELYAANSNMDGYEWYDALPVIKEPFYIEDGNDIYFSDLSGANSGKSLGVRFNVITRDSQEVLVLPTPIIISASSSYGEDNYYKALDKGGFRIDNSHWMSEQNLYKFIDSAWKASYMNDLCKKEWERARSIDVRICTRNIEDALEFILKSTINDAMSSMREITEYAGQEVTLTCKIDNNGVWSVDRN